jgi:hypothetical protein
MATAGLVPVAWDCMNRAVERVCERLAQGAAALERAGVPDAVAVRASRDRFPRAGEAV